MSAAPAPPGRLRGALRTLGGLAPFACLYAAFGATFGLVGTGVPLVFRARGMALADVGWLQLLYLPIGLTFLWAPLVDRFRLPRLAHRTGWIALAQGTTVVLLLVTSLGTRWPPFAFFGVVLGISVALATMDVALEALVVETVPRAARPPVTTARLVGSSLGTAVGVALATAPSERLGLPGALALVAGLDALLLVPILFYPEAARRLGGGEPRAPRPTLARLRRVGPRGAIIGFYFAPAIALGATPSLALIDLGVPLPLVGVVTGPATTAINAVVMIASGFALTRIAAHRQVAALGIGVAASGLALAAATGWHSATIGLGGTLANVAFDAALAIPVFNVMYRWAEGPDAAADYSVLFCIAFMTSFPMRVAGPLLAASLGWPLFFSLVVPVYLLAIFVLARAMRTP